jgi:hypothetical protein
MRTADMSSEKETASVQVRITGYNIYLSRQGFIQNGFFRESNGIITLNFSELTVMTKKVSKILIYFFAEGGVNQKYTYNSFDKSLNFEYPGSDLSAWTSALIHPNEKKLDIQSFDEEDIINIFLSLNAK